MTGVKSFTEHLWFEVPNRVGFLNITDTVRELVRKSGMQEGLCLVNAVHITAHHLFRRHNGSEAGGNDNNRFAFVLAISRKANRGWFQERIAGRLIFRRINPPTNRNNE